MYTYSPPHAVAGRAQRGDDERGPQGGAPVCASKRALRASEGGGCLHGCGFLPGKL